MIGPSGGCEPSSKASLQWKPWHLHLTHVPLELSNTLIESIRLKSPWFNQNLHPFHVHDISPAVKSIPHYRHDFDDRLDNGLDVSDAFTLGWEEAALTGNRAIQKSLQRYELIQHISSELSRFLVSAVFIVGECHVLADQPVNHQLLTMCFFKKTCWWKRTGNLMSQTVLYQQNHFQFETVHWTFGGFNSVSIRKIRVKLNNV